MPVEQISISRLVKFTATQLTDFYFNPEKEKKNGVIKEIVKALPKDSTNFIAMTGALSLSTSEKRLFFTFDHVDCGNLIIEKKVRKGSTVTHLDKCAVTLAVSGACYLTSKGELHTVRKIVEAGYLNNSIEKIQDPLFTLKYGEELYRITLNNRLALVKWAVAKMDCIGNVAASIDFDKCCTFKTLRDAFEVVRL